MGTSRSDSLCGVTSFSGAGKTLSYYIAIELKERNSVKRETFHTMTLYMYQESASDFRGMRRTDLCANAGYLHACTKRHDAHRTRYFVGGKFWGGDVEP
jgi:hypothetical protein